MNVPAAPPSQQLVESLQALSATHRRSRMRALLPLLNSLSREGVPIAVLAAALADAGLPVTSASLRQSLCRWRKRQKMPVRAVANNATASGPSASLPASQPQVATAGEVTSKADLVRLRQSQQHIDLTQLANYGRKK